MGENTYANGKIVHPFGSDERSGFAHQTNPASRQL